MGAEYIYRSTIRKKDMEKKRKVLSLTGNIYNRSRDSSVRISTGCGLDGWGSISGRVKIFSSP
jgi:hypothetical protein